MGNTSPQIMSTYFLSLLAAMALSACQTTPGYNKEYSADISETNIIFPTKLTNLKGFRFKEIRIIEEGSYRREFVPFTGGYIAYDRYFHGGMLAVDTHKFNKTIAQYFEGFEVLKEVKTLPADMGKIYYATVHGKGFTCVFMISNIGTTLKLRGGLGYPGQVDGQYCEEGRKPELSKSALVWMRKIKLKR